MGQSPQIRLTQVENQLIKKQITLLEYKRLKWDLIKSIYDEVETVTPVFAKRKDREITDSLESAYCYIQPGPFIFGAESDYAELKAAIYMGKYPVTVKEFKTFLENSDYDYPEADLEKMNEISPNPDCPVTWVSWEDAKEYCRWLRKETGEYYSIPYELEWEIAARGIDGRFYPWGYREPDCEMVCAQGDKSHEHTAPVTSYPENKSPFGCMNMVGNVWEWCLDAFDDPNDPHVLRGGSWLHGMEYANCTAKICSYPANKRVDYGGFRLIYLPKDMLIDYRKKMEEESEKPEVMLKVIGFAPENEKCPTERKPKGVTKIRIN